VIGGGISGLACAHRLRTMNLPVLLVERGARFGGVIDTVEKDGFRFDIGPQSFLATALLESLIAELNLDAELLRAPSRAPRYILHRGRLVPAPLSPLALLTTPLFGWRTRLRLLADPFRHTRPPDGDESVAAFVRRKLGDDILDNLVAPFVSGVFAGDPEWLSLTSAFPPLRRFEQEHGSILRGALKSARSRKGRTRPALYNFRGGLATLTRAIAAGLGDCARSNAEVAMLRRNAPGEPHGFNVALSAKGRIEPLHVSAVVVATPTEQAVRLLGPIHSHFAEALGRIEYAPVAQVATGYRLADISEPKLRTRGGFGFVVPRSEGLRSLGTVFNSFLFPGRAPEQMAGFTTFLGGATDTAIRACSDLEIASIAHSEVSRVLGIGAAPVAQHVARWDGALPQYNLGHGDIVRSLVDLCAATPGLFLAGNYLAGPSIGSCVEQANDVANRVAEFFGGKETADPSAAGAASG
jgi:oxygen-dependent protoporphyrinogen oxidase